MSNYVPFRPVKCTETKLMEMAPVNGYVYFTSDTQKIFIGDDSKFLEMCASKGICYGQKYIEPDNSGNEPDPIVDFYADEIEGEKLPEVDDLILNMDGCFYRVTDILDEESVRTTRLTLQGTGGGGGSGPGGDITASLRISHYGGQSKYFAREAKTAELGVIAYSGDAANYISSVECSFDRNFENKFLIINNLTHALETPYYVNIASQLSKISKKATVYLRVTDKYGSTRDINYTVTIASLQLATTQAELFGVSADSFDYRCTVGGSLDLESRIIKYQIYNDNNTIIYSNEYELESNQTGAVTRTLDLSSVGHGEYTLKVQIIGMVSGTEIKSNELIHKMLRYKIVGNPIFSAMVPEKAEQYTDIIIPYLLVYGDNVKEYPVSIYINGKLETTQMVVAGTLSDYKFIFDKQGSYILEFKIDDLGIAYTETLNVTKYTGVLPVINIDRDDLKLYLTARGRTNNSEDKIYWPDYKNPNLKGELTDFYFRSVNGWLVDENNVNYLKVSQGAKVAFDAYTPFGVQPKTTGLTIELDFRVSGVLDYDAHLIECISRDNMDDIKTGFFITGNTFNYWASNKELVSLNIVEGQRIKLSYVIEALESQKYPMCYTYLNGIISDVHNYQGSDDFANNPNKPAYLNVDSTFGQIDLYGIRIYSSALDAQTVLNNYQATLDTLEMRQASYEQNLIRDISGDIDLESIETEGYNLQIPYVKIYGGYQTNKEFTMAGISDANKPALPVGKKDYRAIDIEIIYPKEHQNAYFKDYKDFKVTTTFEDSSLNVINGFGKTPEIGAMMYAQGTSSLEYPVKNLRVKLKGSKFTVRPDIEPVKLVTFKADFMESAGAHNTGAANFVDTVYDYVDMQTPGQAQFKNESIVTCIKGHPCVIFWNPGVDEDGNELANVASNYHYIGKYNFNLDKATPEPFGFKEDPADEKFGFLTDENGDLVLKDGKKQNSIFCFEFLDNNEKVCNFLSDATSNANPELTTEAERFYDTWYGTRINADNKEVPGWTIGFESRHPEDKASLNDADALWPFASWLNNLWDMKINQNKRNEAIQKFKDEYQEYLDPEFLLAYYVITEALLMADSRVKNMMIATWGKEHRTFQTSTGEKSVYNYIWYPIFYDMDTMLGLDNTGHVNKNYYDEDTDPGVFNGDEVLWDFVRDALPQEIAQFYSRAEQANGILTKNGILPFFNSNQANMANETFYNEDAFYKYIDTFRNGYTDHLNDKYIAPGTGERLYAAQGSRSMMREYFIENRIKYLRGKYSSTGYQSGDRIEFRINYPKDGEGKDEAEKEKFRKSIAAVPPSGDFHFSSLKTGFAGVKVGQNGVPVNRRFVDEEDITISVDTSGANGTEAYLLGVSNLSSIGDVSDKYLQNLIVGTTDNRLKSLIMGNHHKDYYNPYWEGVNNIGLNGFTYLEEFNLENCESFVGALDFTDCPQIKKILLNGSGSTTLILPPSGVINELRIPPSINNFAIDSHPTLAADKFTLGYFNYEQNKYVNDYSRLAHVSIKNTPINSYEIVRKTLLIPFQTRLESYCFQGVDWEITDANDVEIVNGEIISIKALEKLNNTLAPYDGIHSHAEALTGKLVVNVGDYTVNEYQLYNRYHKIYPNLEIEYISSGVQSASTISFYNGETMIGDPYYSVLTDGTAKLDYLISAEGPAGITLATPVKVSTSTDVFTFSGTWVVSASQDSSIPVGTEILQSNFGNYIPKGDISFTAKFNRADRMYKVKLYDDDGSTVLLEKELPWNADIGERLNNTDYQLTYNYKPYEDKENYPHNRYKFVGWRSGADYNNQAIEPTWKNLKNVVISGDFTAYATYALEDARYNATNIDYFIFGNENNINIQNSGIYSGITISINPLYREAIQDSITLPTYKDKEKTEIIKIIHDFTNMKKLESVYFLPDNQYCGSYGTINAYGFSCSTNNNNQIETTLKNVYLPKTEYFKFIGANTFKNCMNLTNLSDDGTNSLSDNIDYIGDSAFALDFYEVQKKPGKITINELPANLKYLGSNTFYCAGSNITITKLPKGLKTLKSWVFAYCENVNVKVFGSNELGHGLEEIEKAALYKCGSSVNEITLLNSIKKLQGDMDSDGEHLSSEFAAFEGYGIRNSKNELESVKSTKHYDQISNHEGQALSSFAEVWLICDNENYIIDPNISEEG